MDSMHLILKINKLHSYIWGEEKLYCKISCTGRDIGTGRKCQNGYMI